jgi:hypothetical protein
VAQREIAGRNRRVGQRNSTRQEKQNKQESCQMTLWGHWSVGCIQAAVSLF